MSLLELTVLREFMAVNMRAGVWSIVSSAQPKNESL